MSTPRFLQVFFLLSLLTITAFAQETTATLSGTVTDTNRAVIPGAKVIATNEATGLSRSVETESNGSYTLPLLPVGQYGLTVETPGFRKYVQRGITLAVNQFAHVNVQLSVGALTEVLEVNSEVSQVNTEQSGVGQVINLKWTQKSRQKMSPVYSGLQMGAPASCRPPLGSDSLSLKGRHPARLACQRQAHPPGRTHLQTAIRWNFLLLY